MGKYLIADVVWEFNFPQEFNKSNFNAFQTNEKECVFHTINFELVDKIEKLKETNCEEFGLKMYVQDNVKLFDINNKNKVIVRGKYINNTSTYQILQSYEDTNNIINMLSFMRLAEIASSKNIIALNASAITMADKAVIAVKDNVSLFIDNWLKEIDNSLVISDMKLLTKIENNLLKIYNNPWSKKEVNESLSLPVEAIVLLSKGKDNKFIELSDDDKLIQLALYLGITTDTLSNEILMNYCLDILDKVKVLNYRGKIDIKNIFNKIYFS